MNKANNKTHKRNKKSLIISIFPALILCAALHETITLHAAGPAPKEAPLFTDIAKKSGLDFVHFNGMCGEYYFPEMTGQGGGFFDYDNDGDLDVYLIQGNKLGSDKTFKDALYPPRDPNPRDRLFRNDLTIDAKGKRTIRFVDVTDKSGLRMTGYGMGVAAGDFNNDGWIDLYITNYGANRMLFNKGNGTFVDVTEKSGTGDTLWGASAAVFDYDRDGWLDLYVANYVYFDVNGNKKCFARSSRRDYCGPASFPPQKDRFYHNKGDGTFEDVTDKMLVNYHPGAGLGLIVLDVNSDGWLDLYVANDGHPNQLWINDKGKLFRNDALFAGAALNQNGSAEASMGVTAGDFDNDGDEDLFMTHLMGETNTLQVNNGKGLFEDRTIATGLSAVSFPFTSFGTGWVDYDNDGWLDILLVSGAVRIIESLAAAGDPYPIHQPNKLFHSEGGKKFTEATARAGKEFVLSEVSRGAAFGDVDNDGDTDVLVCNNNGPTRLLRNNRGQQNKWLGLRLMDAKKKRDLPGTFVGLKRKGKPTLWRRVRTEGSYCSTNDPRILFGLGESAAVDAVEIFWPDGTKEVWQKPAPMKYTTLWKGAVNKKETP
ncbi:MAG: CRTAC1 family protein [Candidatus Aminicenantes bacterium]|nr:CRTAC1 family protein [Candidatus Aminicenantes bacterium]